MPCHLSLANYVVTCANLVGTSHRLPKGPSQVGGFLPFGHCCASRPWRRRTTGCRTLLERIRGSEPRTGRLIRPGPTKGLTRVSGRSHGRVGFSCWNQCVRTWNAPHRSTAGAPGIGQKSVRTFGADQVEAHDHAAAGRPLPVGAAGVAALARQAFLASSRPRLEVSGSPSEEAMDSSRMRRATSRLIGAGGRHPGPAHSLL